MPKLLVDLDNVLWDLTGPLVDELNERFYLDVKRDDVTRWDLKEFYPVLSREEIFQPLRDRSFWEKMEPRDGAPEALKALKDKGFDIYFVTATHYTTIEYKVELLEKYFSDVYSYDRLILTQVKQMVKGDILIDDNVDNLVWGDYMPILFTSYHNRFEDDTGLNRVNNWEEILKRLRI